MEQLVMIRFFPKLLKNNGDNNFRECKGGRGIVFFTWGLGAKSMKKLLKIQTFWSFSVCFMAWKYVYVNDAHNFEID